MAKVLIVEDDIDIRGAYVFALMRAGYQVVQASDGPQAITLFEKERPDVVLLDMLMPGMSGLDFLRQTNITSRFPQTKILALSNIDTPRVVEQAKELGAAEYLIKVDMTPHQMVDLIKHHLSGSAAGKPTSKTPEQT
jgi:two-component system response regulator (stage 0 sporulation protein F)